MKLKLKDLLDIKFYTHYNLLMKDFNEYIIYINIIAFLIYGLDKFLACKRLTRIPEVVLFLFALLGAPFGSLLGMKVFHHKTRKLSFYIFNIIFLIIYLYVFMKGNIWT